MKGFLQIHDPLRPAGHVVGIDLGTTNSLIASVISGRTEVLPADDNQAHLLPSVVHYAKNGGVIVGKRALDFLTTDPHDTIKSVKRFMGKSMADAESKKRGAWKFASDVGVVKFQVAGGNPVTAIEVSGEILRQLKRKAESYFSGKVERAVITVPAYFDDAQRQATKDAGRLAGLEVLRLLNEPTAAALAYGLEKQAQGIFAVYDLGGGTFDISILELIDGVFQVKAVGGDSALGGDDFDRAIVEKALVFFALPAPTPSQVATLLQRSKAAKEHLTEHAEVGLELNGKTFSFSRDQFEEWTRSLLEKTGLAIRRALKDAQLKPEEIKGVVLVGGSTRVPAVKKYVESIFKKPALDDINPDEVVAIGAAIQADLLTNASRADEVLLLDVTPLSLGLETLGGITEKLITRNSPVPTAQAQIFTTFKDGQTGMDIHVVQGEREMVSDNRSLAKFTLGKIPALGAGLARVQVTFRVDADGILKVSAKEETTGNEQTVTVKPTHGLSDEEIEDMLLASIDHAEEDIQNRLLAEQKVEAERMILDCEKQFRENGDLLSPEEREDLQLQLNAVKGLKESTRSHDVLKSALLALDSAARPFVEKIVNRAVSRASVGHQIHEFDA
jgi:molecular chaperone HscA